MPLEIASEFGYVVAAVGACFVPLVYGALRVMRARGRRTACATPALYAPPENHEKKKQFDCVQRGHQNTLENYAPAIAMGTRERTGVPAGVGDPALRVGGRSRGVRSRIRDGGPGEAIARRDGEPRGGRAAVLHDVFRGEEDLGRVSGETGKGLVARRARDVAR